MTRLEMAVETLVAARRKLAAYANRPQTRFASQSSMANEDKRIKSLNAAIDRACSEVKAAKADVAA